MPYPDFADSTPGNVVLVRTRSDKCLVFHNNIGQAKPKMAVVKTYAVPRRVLPRLDLNRHALAADRAKKADNIYLYRAQSVLRCISKRNRPL
jgi:hypothetical protein